MGKAKPFLFGSLLGAGTMFVALQYHVVRSHDGFQFVPRTPQHSVGLAYADIREWNETQWLDRPELARALMAHGSGDLITQSVAQNLTEAVSSQNATLDQLKSFFDKAPGEAADGSGGAGELKLPDFQPLKPAAPAGEQDVFSIPFPRDAKQPAGVDPFRMARTTEPGSPAAEGPNRVQDPKDSGFALPEFSRQQASAPGSANGNRKSATQREADAVERQLFDPPGSISPAQKPQPTDAVPAVKDVAPFEEVTADLESRARSALSRAQSTLSDTAREATSNPSRFIRNTPSDPAGSVPTANSQPGQPATPTAAVPQSSSDALRALRESFDPFLE